MFLDKNRERQPSPASGGTENISPKKATRENVPSHGAVGDETQSADEYRWAQDARARARGVAGKLVEDSCARAREESASVCGTASFHGPNSVDEAERCVGVEGWLTKRWGIRKARGRAGETPSRVEPPLLPAEPTLRVAGSQKPSRGQGGRSEGDRGSPLQLRVVRAISLETGAKKRTRCMKRPTKMPHYDNKPLSAKSEAGRPPPWHW